MADPAAGVKRPTLDSAFQIPDNAGMNTRDIRVTRASLYFLPAPLRVPLKFSGGTVTALTCARVRVRVETKDGRPAEGWGETPLSVAWGWPSLRPYEERERRLLRFCEALAAAWAGFGAAGHPLEIGHAFLKQELPRVRARFNAGGADAEPMPWLAALIGCSAFDIAVHDAYGNRHGVPVYETYQPPFLERDLSHFLEPDAPDVSFKGRYPADFLARPPALSLPAWHLVGGLDPLEAADRTGAEPDDGCPVTLEEWIARDGLNCLKIKLRGNDEAWDEERLARVGTLAARRGVEWLSADFNCTVTDPAYVNGILDRLAARHPALHRSLLYVEQPFPYDLEKHRIDVRSLSARKPLFMDESAHDWEMIRLGRQLGWTGVALKTCKTQTGALLSLCWARAHGLALMVQDLTNPSLAMIPHALLAAHAGTIMGVETNACQFCPEASRPEEAVHTGLYRRRAGRVEVSTARGPGFGYRLPEIVRRLPPAAVECGGGMR